MGIFSNIIDGFSGKTYRYNTLISDNVAKLLKNIQKEDSLYKKWSTACISSIDNFLEWVLFKGKDEEIFNIYRYPRVNPWHYLYKQNKLAESKKIQLRLT